MAAKKKTADPVPGPNGEALLRIVAYFKQNHPEAWDTLPRGPFDDVAAHMAAIMDAD